MMDAFVYIARVLLASICVVFVLVRCMLTALAFRDGTPEHAPGPVGTIALAYLFLATLITFFPNK